MPDTPFPQLVTAETIMREVFHIPEDQLPLKIRYLREEAQKGRVKSFRFRGVYYFDPQDFRPEQTAGGLRNRKKKEIKDRPNKRLLA